MSETMNTRKKIRTGLLATASSVALLSYVCVAGEAFAASDDDGRPIVWVEFGGQAERASDVPVFAPPLLFSLAPPSVLSVLTRSQEFPPFSSGFEGKLSFQPEDSDWIVSAAIRYGRSGSVRHLHHQTAGLPAFQFSEFGRHGTHTPYKVVYGNVHSGTKESHTILDFQAGKDLGLGLFGAHGELVVSAGVRFAQFTADSHATIQARPIYSEAGRFQFPGIISFPTFNQATYSGGINSERNTKAVGPSLSWKASLPVAGNSSDMMLDVDWGVNGAVLFGRQRANVQHQMKGYYHRGLPGGDVPPKYSHSYTNPPTNHTRSRNVAIPNAGGFIGLSLRSPHAKLSLGYRADFFFGALDGGIDTAKRVNRSFYGPYASISIGLGD